MQQIKDYQIESVLEETPQGITYSAFHIKTNQKVTLYEYLPKDIATRNPLTGEIQPLEHKRVVYKYLMEDFFELFSMLSQLPETFYETTPPCIDVIRCHNTIYGVTLVQEGERLSDYLARIGRELSWAELEPMLEPVYALLTYLHDKGQLHRGICPDNLRLNPKGTLSLCGFGIPALRTAKSEIDSLLYPQFSAPEQFSPSGWQDVYTDVYSFSATCYYALTGVSLVDARLANANTTQYLPILDFPEPLLEALKHGTALNPEQRPQRLETLWGELKGKFSVPLKDEVVSPKDTTQSGEKLAIYIGFLLFIGILGWLTYYLADDPWAIQLPEIPILETEKSDDDDPLEEVIEEPVKEEAEPAPNFEGYYIHSVLETYEGNYTLVTEWTFDEEHSYGIILGQDVHGTDPLGNQQLWLLVSRGSEWATIPDVMGLSTEDATQLLLSQDITYVLRPMIDAKTKAGTIIRMSIEPDTVISKEDEVLILHYAQ